MHREGAWVSLWVCAGFSLDAMTMTEAHFEVNGKAEDERGRSGAGCRRWSAWQKGCIRRRMAMKAAAPVPVAIYQPADFRNSDPRKHKSPAGGGRAKSKNWNKKFWLPDLGSNQGQPD